MKIEFTIRDPEITRLIEKQKKITEERFGEKKTNSDIAEDLFLTGAYRRVAARKWAEANLTPAKPKAKKVIKKVKAKKPAPKKAAPKANKLRAALKRNPKPKAKKVKVVSKTTGKKPAAPAAEAPKVDAASLD